jgi:hypothetical protein
MPGEQRQTGTSSAPKVFYQEFDNGHASFVVVTD